MSSLPQSELPSRQSASPVAARSLAYLVSRYPTLSMIFVLREVVALRQLGFHIETASINPPERAVSEMAPDEAAEAALTYYVKARGITGAAKAHLQTAVSHFIGYCRGLSLVIQLGRLDLKQLFFHAMYFTEALIVGQWMVRMRLKHVHCHLAQQAATVGLYVSRVFGFGYSMTVHGPDEFYDARGQCLSEKTSAADFVVCISSFARSQIMLVSAHDDWDKLVLSRLGVDPEYFVPPEARPEKDYTEILCLGRLTPAKGQHLLVDAVARLAGQGRKVRLRLAGGGPDEEALRRHTAQCEFPECIVFEGAVNPDRVRTLYNAANIFCLPSFAEGIPVALMEAMAMGLPCVSTCIAGIPELIRDGIDGLLVAPGEVDALAGALARLIDDRPLQRQLGQFARRQILENYDLKTSADRLAAIFAERVKL